MAVDIHLKIESPNVEGESKVKGCEGELQLLSASIGLSNNSDPHAGGGAGAGKAHFQEMSCSMYMDKASSTLFLKCATGEHFEKATVTIRKAGGDQQPFLIYEMSEKVFVNSYQAGAGGDDKQVISFSLAYGKLAVSYAEQKDDGTLSAAIRKAYNVATQEKEA